MKPIGFVTTHYYKRCAQSHTWRGASNICSRCGGPVVKIYPRRRKPQKAAVGSEDRRH